MYFRKKIFDDVMSCFLYYDVSVPLCYVVFLFRVVVVLFPPLYLV